MKDVVLEYDLAHNTLNDRFESKYMCSIGFPQHITYHEDFRFVLDQHAELDFGYC
jgi:hypothetical protein